MLAMAALLLDGVELRGRRGESAPMPWSQCTGPCTGQSIGWGRGLLAERIRARAGRRCAATSRRTRSARGRPRPGTRRDARPICLREMGQLGLLGMLIPEEWGGIGMSTVGFVAAMEQIGLADQSVAAAWQAHVTIGSLAAASSSVTTHQRERWLRPLAEGDALGAFGLTEPDAGSDARGIRTRAEPQRRRLADQRSQDLHLQRRDRHVLRRDAARPGRGPNGCTEQTARPGRLRYASFVVEKRHPRLHHGSKDARNRLAGPRHPRAVLRRRVGARASTWWAIPTWGSASSCARSRSAASPSPRSRSA